MYATFPFLFYFRSRPLDVCKYAFGAQTKISAKNPLAQGSFVGKWGGAFVAINLNPLIGLSSANKKEDIGDVYIFLLLFRHMCGSAFIYGEHFIIFSAFIPNKSQAHILQANG